MVSSGAFLLQNHKLLICHEDEHQISLSLKTEVKKMRKVKKHRAIADPAISMNQCRSYRDRTPCPPASIVDC